jgi:hypothetical protein
MGWQSEVIYMYSLLEPQFRWEEWRTGMTASLTYLTPLLPLPLPFFENFGSPSSTIILAALVAAAESENRQLPASKY